ncbi:MAG: ATP-binding protein [Solirubrobacterales bacterium]
MTDDSTDDLKPANSPQVTGEGSEENGDSTEGTLAAALDADGEFQENLTVEIAYEVIQLLSEQLYSSPLKAIEELVVNSWDADASECRVFVPTPDVLADIAPTTAIAVLDNGHGMTVDDLRNLWHVGLSSKRDAGWEQRANRTQIGKFGIGKLASYAIARRVTYLTKVQGEPVRGVTIDFEQFRTAENGDGDVESVTLRMMRFDEPDRLLEEPQVASLLEGLDVGGDILSESGWEHWTLVVLESLKPKAADVTEGRLRWVLSTAMPAASDFNLYLNKTNVASSKLTGDFPVDFTITEVNPERLKSLKKATGVEWTVDGDRLVSDSFPVGVRGRIRVAERSLYAASGKSEDLGRSHGFFVRVRGRLVNETDPLFGAKPVSFTTFYNLLAEVDADDLDSFITAPRDDVVQATEKEHFRSLLLELFNEARTRHEAHLDEKDKEDQKREESRIYVNPQLVERPVADVLVNEAGGSEAKDWLLLDPGEDDEALQRLIESLYEESPERRRYTYKYTGSGNQQAIARFDADQGIFWVNEDHDLVIANQDDPEARRLLEVVITAEAMLEVYLREAAIDPRVVEFVLTRRDQLLRSLARDELYSLKAIAASIRSARDSANELEIAVVGALRSLGFVAKHVSGSGTPDGEAWYEVYGPEQKTFTLEAKSSKDVPSLGNLDFGGLRQHYEDKRDEGAEGCLLVAPAYPGQNEPEEGQVGKRATTQSVSCWTIDSLSAVVEAAEVRHITAEEIQKIVLTKFKPGEVKEAVDLLLNDPGWSRRSLYMAILDSLEALKGHMPNSPRTVDMLAAQIAMKSDFAGIERDDILDAAEQMAQASKGMLHVTRTDGTIRVPGSLDELRRRLKGMTGDHGEPRRRGTFRDRSDS